MFDAFADSVVNISGGTVGDDFDANPFSNINISGGSVGDDFIAFNNSVVNISGGSLDNRFIALDNSEVNISGTASVGDHFLADAMSEVNITGGMVGDFAAANAFSRVEISGGIVGDNFDARAGSEIFINGDVNFGINFNVENGSFVMISDGSFDFGFNAGGTVDISGGAFGDALEVLPNNDELNISGGVFGTIRALNNSKVNLLGSNFEIAGVPVTGLLPGVPMPIADRDVTLTTELADGTPFDINLNSNFSSGDDFFPPVATLAITLTSSVLLGDVNLDGTVNLLDVAPFVEQIGNGGEQVEADVNQDGTVDLLDVAPFVEILAAP